MEIGSDEDKDDFEAVHRAHHEAVYNYILSRVSDTETAEDLTVEVFLNAYRSWNSYRTRQQIPVQEWLLAIAQFNCDNYRRFRRS